MNKKEVVELFLDISKVYVDKKLFKNHWSIILIFVIVLVSLGITFI